MSIDWKKRTGPLKPPKIKTVAYCTCAHSAAAHDSIWDPKQTGCMDCGCHVFIFAYILKDGVRPE